MDRFSTRPGTLASLGFEQPDASAAILEELAGRSFSIDQLKTLAEDAAKVPSPDQALAGIFGLAETSPEIVKEIHASPKWWQTLLTVMGTSQALNRFLIANPQTTRVLSEPLVQASPTQLREAIGEAVGLSEDQLGIAPATFSDAQDRLRIANRIQLTRITGRDLTGDPEKNLSSVSRELSDLADAVLCGAVSIAKAEIPNHDQVSLAIIAMGKCGGQELNYLSDVDVIFVGEPANPQISTEQAIKIATRLASTVTRVCSAHTSAGTIWDLDAALRPEGKAGPLVRTLASMATYYEKWAQNWEFQALLKARPAAGDLVLGQKFCQLVEKYVWEAAEKKGFVAEARALRKRVINHILAEDATKDVKLCPGGLRDIEFSAQLLQLVHGRADQRLRQKSTLAALKALTDWGYIGRKDGATLADSYRFERVLEHRIQLLKLHRNRIIPRDEHQLRVIARSLNLSTGKELLAKWENTRVTVRNLHERVFYSPVLEAVSQISSEELKLSNQAAQTRLKALDFLDPAAALRHIEALTQGYSRRTEIQRQLLPAMLGWFATGPNPDNALLSFRQLSEKLGESPWYLRALRDEGEMAQRLGKVLSSSRYAVDLLQGSPDAVQLLANDSFLVPRTRTALIDTMKQVSSRHDDPDKAIEAVRGVYGRERLRISLGIILGLCDVEQSGQGMSDLVDALIETGLEITSRSTPESPQLGVIAMGRWGGRELGLASDADVMFVIDTADETGIKQAQNQAANLRKLLGRQSSNPGIEIDADLRPEGKDGPLVRTVSAYKTYYSRWSSTWESQALLRARFAGGNQQATTELLEYVDPIRYPENGLTPAQIGQIRKLKVRMDKVRRPGGDPMKNTKLGPGGLVDIEWTVQLIQLCHAWQVPELKTTSTLAGIKACVSNGLISESEGETLRDGWLAATRMRNMAMLVRGRPTDTIPQDSRELAAVGSLLGYARQESGEVLDDYLRLTRHSAKIVEKLFWENTP